MKRIKIDQELKDKLPDFHVGVLSFEATPKASTELDPYLKELEMDLQSRYTLEDVRAIPNIEAARQGYKMLGKDPSRYRLAVESLYRRIVKGNPLYRINTLVDLGNILSLKAMRSTAVLDEEKIEGDTIHIRIGRDEPYEGIGRGTINVENIPVYCDTKGPFGSTTSDTERTAINSETKRVCVLIISFNGHTNLLEDLLFAKEIFMKFANAVNFSQEIF